MFDKYKQRKAELEKERVLLQDSIKEAKALDKDLKALKKTIEAYHKQGAVLLLEDLDEDLIKKLQSVTEDNVIVIFTKDGTRVEIKSNEANYKRNTGAIR
jgi:hypothetical protein